MRESRARYTQPVMNRLWSLVGFACTCALMAPSAHANTAAPRVAVVVALSVNADDAQLVRLERALAAALEHAFAIETLAGSDVRTALGDAGVPDDCVAKRACVRELADKLDADQLLLLTVVRVGDRFQIAITWGDGQDGRTASRVTIDIDVEQQDPQPVFAVYAGRLLPDAPPRTDKQDDADTGPATDDGAADVIKSSVDTRDTGRKATMGVWVATGLGVAFVAAGATFGLLARSDYNELESGQCLDRVCPEDDIDRLAFRARMSDALFGAALLSGVTAAVLYWRSGKSGRRSSRTGARISVHPGAHGALLSLGGRF